MQIASAYHYGLDQEDYFADAEIYNGPGLFEHRMTDHIMPLVNNLVASGRRTAPDLVEISSGAYDLMRWAKQDIESGSSTTEPVKGDRITWYRFRVGQIMDVVRKAFPAAKGRVWRSVHYPTDQAAELEYYQVRTSPAYFSDLHLIVLGFG